MAVAISSTDIPHFLTTRTFWYGGSLTVFALVLYNEHLDVQREQRRRELEKLIHGPPFDDSERELRQLWREKEERARQKREAKVRLVPREQQSAYREALITKRLCKDVKKQVNACEINFHDTCPGHIDLLSAWKCV